MSSRPIVERPPFIREHKGKFTDKGAVILGKGPSLDVWWDRGGCQDRENWLVLTANEAVLIPGLNPDFWFWAGPEHARHVEEHGGMPASTTQVFIEYMYTEDPEYAQERAAAYPTLLYMRGTDAPDDPYAVPGFGFAPAAMFFCAALWKCREVLAVGFDGLDAPHMKEYANCIPHLIYGKHKDPTFSPNNIHYKRIVETHQLKTTWYHRGLTEEEIQAAHQKFPPPKASYFDPERDQIK